MGVRAVSLLLKNCAQRTINPHCCSNGRSHPRYNPTITPVVYYTITRATAVTTRINTLRQTKGANVWQRGYYERIIRDENELNATRQYIVNNLARWEEDRDNLDALLAKMTYHP